MTACSGPPKVRETEEREPAWATDFAAETARACECKDDPCIRDGRASLDAMVAMHGGIEEAPPTIHENLTRFEACWLATSRDLGRDLGASADEICTCDSTDCVLGWEQKVWKLADKYGAASPDTLRDGADPTAVAAYDRAAGCLAAVTITAQDYLAILDTTNAELCACTMPDCGKAALDRSQSALGKYLVVRDDSTLAGAVATAKARRCKCAKKFPDTTDIDREVSIAGMPIRVTGYFSMQWSCSERVE